MRTAGIDRDLALECRQVALSHSVTWPTSCESNSQPQPMIDLLDLILGAVVGVVASVASWLP